MATESVWMGTARTLVTSALNESIRADVTVVGAGIAGMTTAYLLQCEGKAVVVLDDGPVCGGMTQRTTAHLTNAVDDRYFEIERIHGEKGARNAARSHTAAINRIEQIVREEGMDCDFERLDGYLFVSPGESREVLDRELAAVHRAGLTDVALLERGPAAHWTTACLRFPRQAQFHPVKYVAALATCIKNGGGRIYTSTHVDAIRGGTTARVQTGRIQRGV